MLCMETGEAGLRTARLFGQQFEVPSTVVNGYIDNTSELPKYGQLGCGGFIVLGGHGQFVAARTAPAYLDKGPRAFTAVEQLLSSLGVQPATPIAQPADAKRLDVPLRLSPVGNAQMDEEHEELVATAAALERHRSPSGLARLRDLWAQHSEHEEALFERHDFAGHRRGGDLSGTASHCKHHRAILDRLDLAVRRAEEAGPARLVDESAVREIVAEMQRHGDVYDGAYAGKLG